MTDDQAEKIIKSNMTLQMNLTGIRTEFEEAIKRKPLTDEEIWKLAANCLDSVAGRMQFARAIEAKLKEKNT